MKKIVAIVAVVLMSLGAMADGAKCTKGKGSASCTQKKANVHCNYSGRTGTKPAATDAKGIKNIKVGGSIQTRVNVRK